jgi:hypothetical protein
MGYGLSSSLSARSQFAYVVPDLLTVVVDLCSSRRVPTQPFVQPLSASVRFVRPQLRAGETPLSGIELGQAQHLGTQPSSPTIGTDSDHRYMREPGQRIRAGPVVIEGLKDECHRNERAVFFHKLCEARRISKATLDLLLSLSNTTAGHRPQRQPKLRLPSNVRCYPQPSYGRDVSLARNTSCRHQVTLLRRQLDGRGSRSGNQTRPADIRQRIFVAQGLPCRARAMRHDHAFVKAGWQLTYPQLHVAIGVQRVQSRAGRRGWPDRQDATAQRTLYAITHVATSGGHDPLILRKGRPAVVLVLRQEGGDVVGSRHVRCHC